MEEIKQKLESLLEETKTLREFDEEKAKTYVEHLKDFCTVLKQEEKNARDKSFAGELHKLQKVLKVEIYDRFDPYFYNMREKKKRDELKYSALLVSDALKKFVKSTT